MDKQERTITIIHAERNLQHPINPAQPIGELKTWMDPNVFEELNKKCSMLEISKKYASNERWYEILSCNKHKT